MSMENKKGEESQINITELRNKNFEEITQYLITLIDEYRKFEAVTKAEIIKLMAEKLVEAGYPSTEVKDLILERLGDRVTRPYVLRCLPDEYKNPKSIAARKGKPAKQQQAMTNTGGITGASTVMEEPQQEPQFEDNDHDGADDNIKGKEYQAYKESLQRDELPDIKPQLESEVTIQTSEGSEYSEGYVKHLKQQIKALKGELGYQDSLATIKVAKLDKLTENRIYNASKASKVNVVLLIDIRTNQVTQVYTDTEWKKQTIYAKKD